MRKTFITLLATIASFIAMNGVVFAEGSSTDFYLDYNHITDSASQSESLDFKLISGIPSISSDGSSISFLLRNIYYNAISTCGNGVIESGEQCEGVNFNGITCSSFGYDQGVLQCVSCTIDLSACSRSGGGSGGGGGGYNPSLCGNGYRETGEQCDDGNNISGDGCSAYCRRENHHCGNGIREGEEECDDGNVNTNDGCTPECKFEKISTTSNTTIKIIDNTTESITNPEFSPEFKFSSYQFFEKTKTEPSNQLAQQPTKESAKGSTEQLLEEKLYCEDTQQNTEQLSKEIDNNILHSSAKEKETLDSTYTFYKWINPCLLIWILIGIIIILSLMLIKTKIKNK